MFYLSQSEISFHIIVTEYYFGVGTSETIRLLKTVSLPVLNRKKSSVFLLAKYFQRIFFFVFDQSES